jgi:hypothetical protein
MKVNRGQGKGRWVICEVDGPIKDELQGLI